MVLKAVLDKILEIPEDGLRGDYARALWDSIQMDKERTPPKPRSPQQIAEFHGVNIEDQVEYGVSVTKKGAVEFLTLYGKRMRRERFYKRVTAESYKSHFGRRVSRLGQKAIVLTYAEVQHITGYGSQMPFPQELKKYLKE